MTLLDDSPSAAPAASPAPSAPKPMVVGEKGSLEQVMLYIFVIVPFLAVLAAVPLAWGWGLGWTDIALAFVFYMISGLGITVGFHRYFTHAAFKTGRPLRIALAIAGTLAVEGPVITWVSDHRRHHAFSDKEGDPHSPWRFGTSTGALMKGLFWAHLGWLFDTELTNKNKYAPDLVADKDISRISRLFPVIAGASVFAPAILGGLITWSWVGALTAFFWASLIRIALLHHVTWAINSICHTIGERPYASRDKSANFWPLALLSFGESWHNSHHADPTCARHGVRRGQLDISARVIWAFEKLGAASAVRWPKQERFAKLEIKKLGVQ